jgi:hypothetical protein
MHEIRPRSVALQTNKPMDTTVLALRGDGVIIQSFEFLILTIQVPLDLSESSHW